MNDPVADNRAGHRAWRMPRETASSSNACTESIIPSPQNWRGAGGVGASASSMRTNKSKTIPGIAATSVDAKNGAHPIRSGQPARRTAREVPEERAQAREERVLRRREALVAERHEERDERRGAEAVHKVVGADGDDEEHVALAHDRERRVAEVAERLRDAEGDEARLEPEARDEPGAEERASTIAKLAPSRRRRPPMR